MSKSAEKAAEAANLMTLERYIELNGRTEPTMKNRRVELPNVHPVDELAAVREEIKILQERADELRDGLLKAGSADLRGDQYTANIIPSVRETLDKKALIEAFGEAAIFPFIKVTHFKTVKLVEN